MVNLPLMGYNIKIGATRQELPEKWPILRKKRMKLLLKIERKESKELKSFQKLLELMSQSPQ